MLNIRVGTPRRIPRLILYSASNKSRSAVGGVGCSVAKPRTANLYASPQHVVLADGTGPKIRYALSGSMKALKEGECAYDRAGAQDKAQVHARVGRGPLLQQRYFLRGARLPRRRGHLRRAPGQGERRGAPHLRDDRGPEDSRRRSRARSLTSVRWLASVAPEPNCREPDSPISRETPHRAGPGWSGPAAGLGCHTWWKAPQSRQEPRGWLLRASSALANVWGLPPSRHNI